MPFASCLCIKSWQKCREEDIHETKGDKQMCDIVVPFVQFNILLMGKPSYSAGLPLRTLAIIYQSMDLFICIVISPYKHSVLVVGY